MHTILNKNEQFFKKIFSVKHQEDWDLHQVHLKDYILNVVEKEFDTIFNEAVLRKEEELEENQKLKVKAKKYIEGFFNTSNFAYAWYRSESKSFLFLAASIEMKDNLGERWDIDPLLNHLQYKHNIILCVQRYVFEILPFLRLNEDLEFLDFRGYTLVSDDQANMYRTCSERVIFENIIWHFHHPKAPYEDPDFKAIEDLDIKLYTFKEPCLHCYAMMKQLKEEYIKNLKLKVFYRYWLNEDMKTEVYFNRLMEIFPVLPSDDAFKLMFKKLRQRGTYYEFERMARYIEKDKKNKRKRRPPKKYRPKF